MAATFTDMDGAVLTLSPTPGNGALVTITDKTSVSIVLPPGTVLAASKIIVDSTRLSEAELKRVRAGKKLKYNKYGRAGEAEAPEGEYKDKAGNIIMIYPDKANRVLLELAGRFETLYYSISPDQALDVMHQMRVQTGLTGKQLVLAAYHAGLLDLSAPAERHDIKRHQKLMQTEPGYAELIDIIEGKAKPSGKSFIKKEQKPHANTPASISRFTHALALDTPPANSLNTTGAEYDPDFT